MTRRVLSFVLVAAVLLVASPIAYADAIFGNQFFYENEDRTEQISGGRFGRGFMINSPSGYVIPTDEPGSENGIPSSFGYYSGWGYEDIDEPEEDIFVFRNGEIVSIEATYLHDGRYWGVMSPSHRYQPPGWVLMDDLLVIYQTEDFERENSDSFYTYTGSYDAVLAARRLVDWQWPGSDREKRIINDNIQRYADVRYAYMDEEGRECGKQYLEDGFA